MRTNGEAIYGTRAGLVANQPWGRSTTKGNTLYLHVFTWPGDGTLVVRGLSQSVRHARLLAGGALETTKSGDELVIRLPPRAPDSIASVIALDLAR